MIFPHQFHDGHFVPQNENRQRGCLVITFDCENSYGIESLRNTPRQLSSAGKAVLGELLESYHERQNGLETALHLSRLLDSLMTAPPIPNARHFTPADAPDRALFLQAVHQYLERPLHGESLLGMARELGLDESLLRRKFAKYTGKSLSHYLRERRMGQALTMLKNQEGKIAEISEKLGFSSVQAFSRSFKSALGFSPKQYELLLRKNRSIRH